MRGVGDVSTTERGWPGLPGAVAEATLACRSPRLWGPALLLALADLVASALRIGWLLLPLLPLLYLAFRASPTPLPGRTPEPLTGLRDLLGRAGWDDVYRAMALVLVVLLVGVLITALLRAATEGALVLLAVKPGGAGRALATGASRFWAWLALDLLLGAGPVVLCLPPLALLVAVGFAHSATLGAAFLLLALALGALVLVSAVAFECLRQLAWRACLLTRCGPLGGIKRGWPLLRFGAWRLAAVWVLATAVGQGLTALELVVGAALQVGGGALLGAALRSAPGSAGPAAVGLGLSLGAGAAISLLLTAVGVCWTSLLWTATYQGLAGRRGRQ